jgi:hypothetical protein
MKAFGYILKIVKSFLKKVMGFNATNVLVKDENKSKIQNSLSSNQLNVREIEILLSLMKRSTFLGEDIEPIYNLIIKLQNQYLEQTK